MAEPSLKILFSSFGVVPDATGLSTRLTEFMRTLQNRAVVDGLTIKPPDRAHIERYFGARLMRVPVGSGDINGRIQAFERALQRQVTSDDYAVIHATDPFSGDLLARLKAEHDFKLVYDACGFPSIEFRYTDPHLEGDRAFMLALRQREQTSLQAADAVLAPNAVTRDYLIKRGVPAEKITVMGPAVDLSLMQSAVAARPERIPMRMLYLGSQVSWQGLPTLLFALRDALKQPDALGTRLSIVGPAHPEWRHELEEQVKGRGIAGSVEFLDPVGRDDLPKILSQHDVGVAALEKSDRNVEQGGLVMKVAEYAASGRPMIVSDLPLARSLVDETCARFFPAGREKELGKVIAELAANPAKRAEMGRAARQLAEGRFDADQLGALLWALYQRLAEELQVASTAPVDDNSDVPTAVGALVEDRAQADTGQIDLPHARRTDEIPIVVPAEPAILAGVPMTRTETTPIVEGAALGQSTRITDEIPIVIPEPSARSKLAPPVADFDAEPAPLLPAPAPAAIASAASPPASKPPVAATTVPPAPPSQPRSAVPPPSSPPPPAAAVPRVVSAPVASAPTPPPAPASAVPPPSARPTPAPPSVMAAVSRPAAIPPAPSGVPTVPAAAAQPAGKVAVASSPPLGPATPTASVAAHSASTAQPALLGASAAPAPSAIPKPTVQVAAPTPSAPALVVKAAPAPSPSPPPAGPPPPAVATSATLPGNTPGTAAPAASVKPPVASVPRPAVAAPVGSATPSVAPSALPPSSAVVAKPAGPVSPPAVAPRPTPAATAGVAAPGLPPPMPPRAGTGPQPALPSKPPIPTAQAPLMAAPTSSPPPLKQVAAAVPAVAKVASPVKLASVPSATAAEPELLEAEEFQSLSEATELPADVVDDADLVFDLPSPTPEPARVRPSGDGNSVASGPTPWLHGAILGFSPMGQLHMPDYISVASPLFPQPESTKATS